LGNEKSNINKVCAVIPTYNNAGTLEKVITEVKTCINTVIVIDDGSTDNTKDILSQIEGITIISFKNNKGKGAALKTGIRKSIELGFDYMLTIDSDGQHSSNDIPKMLEELEKNPDSLLIGSRNIQADGMPGKNTFANKFSNFWFWAETNLRLPDTQSGFRIYPVKFYKKSNFFTNRFEFEIEILVRSAWSDIKIVPVPVSVYYPPEDERISHFRPLPDFTRISTLNTVLVLITFLYILPIRAFKYITRNKFTKVVSEQIKLHNENASKVSSAIGFGLFMGIIPIWGFQMLVAALLAHFFRLNKIIVLAFSNISIPPFIPFIIFLSYKAGGIVLDNPQEFNADTISYLKDQILHGTFYETMNEFGYSIFQYIIGSFIFATIMGIAGFLISFVIIKLAQRK
jgi:glycosyltransferase involved in cell wall biosynthesis